MGVPATPEDLERVRQEHNKLMDAWNQLGMVIHGQVEAAKEPVHPPAAIASVVTDLTFGGFIPTFPLWGGPDAQIQRDARLVVGAFRWAQQCARNGIWFEDLLKCTCADVDPNAFEDIYKYLGEET